MPQNVMTEYQQNIFDLSLGRQKKKKPRDQRRMVVDTQLFDLQLVPMLMSAEKDRTRLSKQQL
ncbi:hypothetical protein T06_4506 [Trichinella sp. T6]|nr:hypothetical protein T06_4506 [Trichinella sp. T6]